MSTSVGSAAGAVFLRGLNPLYPHSDGKPMAENTVQAFWIDILFDNYTDLFGGLPDALVAMDNLVYPVQGEPQTCVAPDIYVAFGVPAGHRASYLVWEEGVFPQVIWEVRSPGNSAAEMARKHAFYERHGAEEYYDFNPQRRPHRLTAYRREADRLVAVPEARGYVSPLTGVRFDFSSDGELALFRPNGDPFLSYRDLSAQSLERKAEAEAERRRAVAAQSRARESEKRAASAEAKAERERLAAESQRLIAERERLTAENERLNAENERLAAENERKRAAAEAARAAAAEAELAALRARLRELGLPDGGPPL